MNLLDHSEMDAVAYILILFSLASLMFLFTQILVHIYDRNVNPVVAKGYQNGHARGDSSSRVRDVEEFELEGLSSDDEGDDEHGRMLRRSEEGPSLDSHSTVGKNQQSSI